jgi:CBS domain-containing protein
VIGEIRPFPARHPFTPDETVYIEWVRRAKSTRPAGWRGVTDTGKGTFNMTVAAVLKNKGNSVVSVDPSATALEIAEIITARRIGAVLVLGTDTPVAGIVSERDVVKALARQPDRVMNMRADEMMTRDVKTATLQTSVDEAMEIMDAGYFRHLPVVDGNKLVGIISIRDLVKYRIMLHEHDVDSLRAYIARQV